MQSLCNIPLNSHFQNIFTLHFTAQPVIVMSDEFTENDILDVLQYAYKGEVVIETARFPHFLKIAEKLELQGLKLKEESQEEMPASEIPLDLSRGSTSTKHETSPDNNNLRPRTPIPKKPRKYRRNNKRVTEHNLPSFNTAALTATAASSALQNVANDIRLAPPPPSPAKNGTSFKRSNDDGDYIAPQYDNEPKRFKQEVLPVASTSTSMVPEMPPLLLQVQQMPAAHSTSTRHICQFCGHSYLNKVSFYTHTRECLNNPDRVTAICSICQATMKPSTLSSHKKKCRVQGNQ